MKKTNVKKLTVTAMMIALTVSLSAISFPVGASRCYPIQHLMNVMAAIFLGPSYAVASAFCTSLIRNLIGTGSLLAFPGSMVGALLSGLLYKYTHKLTLTYIGEVFGTGIIGGILCYPVAVYLMGREAAVFAYVLPFLVSTLGGTCIAAILAGILYKSKTMDYLQRLVNSN
ncbi:MAG: energy coupling factor transporter S component ThiW [Oscillospiraceae bacterium]